MKVDERRLLEAVAGMGPGVTVRDVVARLDTAIPPKRAWYLLEKWAGKGWYEYGVALDLGWLTDAGRAAAAETLVARILTGR